MGWRSVIITQHAKLSYSSRMMTVQNRDGINQIPIEDINLLLINTTQAVITSSLISHLAKNEVKVIFSDDMHEPICETVGYYPSTRDIDLLEQQVNWTVQKRETLWTKIIFAKIQNQIKVLMSYGENVDEINDELEKIEMNDFTNREATVARKYFPLLFETDFVRRNNSPINAALNYGYSILLSTVNQEVVSNGYLTYIGIHHHSEENMFNLSSDLMEPFRPVIDYWVAGQKFYELTPDVKYGLVELLSLEIIFNGKKMLLKNAISEYVRNCLNFLSGNSSKMNIEVGFTNEVPSYAINDNV
ncbi:type II CRISPR-associated endonuclease Cas1 [Ligilactobacillus acidipiscis]|jgi:CRISPR-associated endonuclease Cas1|uniref:type II CRISPR-associated endonuclease Cas1 n=1 Tax=Ligilactobacillus acidipiscis TaxID=89059 RepID=UPI002FDAD5AC|nr:type II CRISPR-associated endonuclease Cas1 [Ligilactobacillus acidipiscis]